MSEKITLTDIAQQTGVSIVTVSLALNNRPGVAEKTRSRVSEAAAGLGYPLRPTQANGRTTGLATLGMIVKADAALTPAANPFYSKIILGIEGVCRHEGIHLMFGHLLVDDDNRPTEIPAMLDAIRVDGLLMVGAFVDHTLTRRPASWWMPIRTPKATMRWCRTTFAPRTRWWSIGWGKDTGTL